MQNYRKTSHTTYDCKYHVVWITKYRKKVVVGIAVVRAGESVRRIICKEHDVEILKGRISRSYVQLLVSAPPHLATSKLVQYLKGKSSYRILMENKLLSKEFSGVIFGLENILLLIRECDR